MESEEKIRNAVNKVLQTANRKLLDLNYELDVRIAILSIRTKIKLNKNHNENNRHNLQGRHA